MKQKPKEKGIKAWAVYIYDHPISLHLYKSEAQDAIKWSKHIPTLKKITNARIIQVLITPLKPKTKK